VHTSLRALGALALAATTSVALLTTALPAQAAPDHRIRLGALERGEDAEVPIIVGDRVHDGDLRVPVEGYGFARLLGASGEGYVISGLAEGESRVSVSLVAPDGELTRVASRIDEATLSDDGSVLVTSRQGRRASTLRILDTGTGDVLASRDTAPWASVLDVDATRAVVGAWEPPRTRVWRWRADRMRTLRRAPAQHADLSAGVFAVFTGDPYQGGCSVMARMGAPRKAIWRDCDERVLDTSPGGDRMLTTHILADGPGPGQVHLRRTAGRRLASFTAPGYFLGWTFEDDQDVLLDTAGRRRAAWVRGDEDGVERVTRLRPAPEV